MNSSTGREGLPSVTPPLLLIRLSPCWTEQRESIEPGYERAGHGWYPDVSVVELVDSMRAWWRLSIRSAQERNVQYAVAVVDGVTRMVMSVDAWIGPREDGRVAFQGFPITDGPVFDLLVGNAGKSIPAAPGAANPLRYWPPSREAAAGPPPTGVQDPPPETGRRSTPPEAPTAGTGTLPPPAPSATSSPLPPPPNNSGGNARSDAQVASNTAAPGPGRIGLVETVFLAAALRKDLNRLTALYADHAAAMDRADIVRRAFALIDWRQRPECQIGVVGRCTLIEPRKGASTRTWTSSSSGRSYSGIRIGPTYFGSSSGSVSSGESISHPPPDILKATDTGQFIVTAERVSFVGSMFSQTITPEKVAGYEASGRRILFAAKNSKKVWIAQFASGEDFVLATSAVIVWDELYTRLAKRPGSPREVVGPQVLDWLLGELVGEHPGEIWALRRAAHTIERIADSLGRQRPLLMKVVSRQVARRSTPPRIVTGQTEACWSCGRPIVLGRDPVCACSSDVRLAVDGRVPYLSDRVNRHRFVA